MPIHTYHCPSCGAQFEHFYRKASQVKDVKECISCQAGAQRVVSESSHTFQHTPDGPTPQDTGVYEVDHNPEIVIGRDAEAKWKLIDERENYKNALLRQERSQGKDVYPEHLVRTREGAGDYRIVGEQERKAINERRALARAVAEKAKGD